MYTLDYSIKVEEALSPDKRTPSIVAYNRALVGDVANNHVLLFSTYKEFQSLPMWAAGSYDRRSLVRYGKSVFQSNISGNTDEPTFTDNWLLVSTSFLGNDFRLKIRGEKLVLEYALNIWFDTVFRQPPAVSEIFITTNQIQTIPIFRVGAGEEKSSSVGANISSGFVGTAYTFAEQFNLNINVPLAVYNALAASDDARTSIIKSFAGQYMPAGITYKITTY